MQKILTTPSLFHSHRRGISIWECISADVSHYVKENSAMDVDSKNRGMSCYLVDRVIPMLPEKLSNDLCSLKSDVDRLTKSTFTVIDRTGRIIEKEIADTVIHSKMRLNYGQVQSYIDGKSENGADNITPRRWERL